MTTESWLWKKLKYLEKNVHHNVHLTRHEDECTSGIPDVSYGIDGVNGWIELKAYKHWPKKPETVIPFKNFKISQKRFLRGRGKAGGYCFVMVVFGKEIVLFHWTDIHVLGETNKEELLKYAIYKSDIPIAQEELIKILTDSTF